MITKDKAYLQIQELTERFAEQIDSYKSGEYNETQTRRDFIDPFFKALGWDVDNSEGNAEAYREVIHEDKIKIGKATKAPDYSFRLPGGKRLFFVEARNRALILKAIFTRNLLISFFNSTKKNPKPISPQNFHRSKAGLIIARGG